MAFHIYRNPFIKERVPYNKLTEISFVKSGFFTYLAKVRFLTLARFTKFLEDGPIHYSLEFSLFGENFLLEFRLIKKCNYVIFKICAA